MEQSGNMKDYIDYMFKVFPNFSIRRIFQRLQNKYYSAVHMNYYVSHKQNLYGITFWNHGSIQGFDIQSLSDMISQNPHRPRRCEQETSFRKQARLQEREKFAKELDSDKLKVLEQELSSLKQQIQNFQCLSSRNDISLRNEENLFWWKTEE
eukprot:jgi/Galph1/2770/GphlegSOOS_G1391.1